MAMTIPELNEAVAREVMGWTLSDKQGWWDTGGQMLHVEDWSPATDIAAAMGNVVGEMQRRGRRTFVEFVGNLVTLCAHAGFPDLGTGQNATNAQLVMWHLSPRILCEAALATVRNES